MSRIGLTIPGGALAWGRAIPVKRGTHVALVTPERTRTFQSYVKDRAHEAMQSRDPIDECCLCCAQFWLPIPGSWSRKKQREAGADLLFPVTKPDLDNVFKSITDAMSGIVYRDDKLIVRALLEKRYSVRPSVGITIVYGAEFRSIMGLWLLPAPPAEVDNGEWFRERQQTIQ